VASKKHQPEYRFDLSGGVLCLDFANTISHRGDAKRVSEHLRTHSDLVSFAEQSKIISPSEARVQRLRAAGQAAEAQRSYANAIQLRETLFRIFFAVAVGKSATPQDLKLLNDVAREALAHRELVRDNGVYRWRWKAPGSQMLNRIPWSVAQSAAELLTSGELATVRLCDAPDCDWLFLDNSRNRSRRWCDMKSCGNRQKARRHYLRSHE
jgi:predicted RNA-binding Zn ribbon-like protein